MFGIPSPWLILGCVLAMLGVYIAGDHNGSHRKDNEWKAAQAEVQRKHQTELDAWQAKYSALKGSTDATYLNGRKDVDDAYSRGLRAGKLRDKGGRCVGPSQTAGAAVSSSDGSAGCELSDATSAALRDLARDADLAAIYAQAGHNFAVGVSK